MRKHSRRILLLPLVIAAAAAAQTWNHDPNSPNGPKNWGFLGGYNSFATCGTDKQAVGAKQTPVDIVTTSAQSADLPHLEFHYTPTHLVVENLTHVVEVMNEADDSSLIAGPSLADRYHLVQFHFHTPSEHTIDGSAAKMELHLVHQNALGDLAVVGVMMNADDGKTNPLFDRIFNNAPYLNFFSGASSSSPVLGEMNPLELLPEDRTYYSYTGSLTTPPCTEGVRWFVLTHPVSVSKAAVTRFQQLLSQSQVNNFYPFNNRPVQPLNGRPVLVSH